MEANYQTNLSINDYLFDEILVNIFTYLNGGQLRICREVCNKWNDLLKADKFLAQWQCLHIKRISGLNDIIYLMNSDWKFKKLVFRNIMWKSFLSSVMNDFWIFLSKTVEEIKVDIDDLDDFINLLQFFPSLQILRITDPYCPPYCIYDKSDLFLMNLKELYLEDYSNFHDIGALIARYPKLKSLDYNSSSGVPSEKVIKDFKRFPSYWKKFTWYDYHFDFKQFRTTFLEMEDFLEEIESLEFQAHTDFKFLSKIMESHSQIKNVQIYLQFFPSCNAESEIHCIHEVLDDPAVSLKVKKINYVGKLENLCSLAKFPNISHITFTYHGLHCPIGHEFSPQSSLKVLQIKIENFDCEECFNTLVRNFQYLEKFTLTVTQNLPIKFFFSDYCDYSSVLHHP